MNEYVGAYGGSYGGRRNLIPKKFKALGKTFNPDKIKDPDANALYLRGERQCTNYCEVKQGGKLRYDLATQILLLFGYKPEDVYIGPVLADREKDSDYKPYIGLLLPLQNPNFLGLGYGANPAFFTDGGTVLQCYDGACR
jgi:hypothetical protein